MRLQTLALRIHARRFLRLIVIGLVLIACTEEIVVKLAQTEDSTPTFTLEPGGLFASGCAEISSLAVRRNIEGRLPERTWTIAALDRDPKMVCAIQFGKVPAGFEETDPPRTLQRGLTYGVSVRGLGSHGGLTFEAR